MMFIKHPEMIPDDFFGVPEVKEAMEELTHISYDREVREEYEARLKLKNDEISALTVAREEGMEKGREEGMEKGREEGITVGMEKGREEGITMGMEKGREEGMEKGIEKGKIETALAMLKESIPVGVIAKCTGLSPEEIAKLTQE
jgi:predicted transposase/invertase (TIGR01784 family)